MIEKRYKFLETLQPGEKVILNDRYGERSVQKITRYTKTLFIIRMKTDHGTEYDLRFARKDGYEVGADIWRKKNITEWTQEAENEIRYINFRKKMIKCIQNFDWKCQPTKLLQKIYNILESHKMRNPDTSKLEEI